MPQTISSAVLMCTMGASPGTLTVLPTNKTLCSKAPAATIMDHAPLLNIGTFGMCMSLANPVVASATAAALGALTPMPCVPATAAPWTPGSPTVLIGKMPALNDSSMCMCNWAGMISITFPGQAPTLIP
jgi:hypothetical protein